MTPLARKLAARWPARLRPGSWPVRWRLAGVSAGLTLIILLVFGAVIGQVATSRIRNDFNREVSDAAQTLAREFQIVYTPLSTISVKQGPRLDDFVRPDGASARVLDVNGNLIKESTGASPMGPPSSGLSNYGELRVATAVITDESGGATGYVQYGRSIAHVDSTIDRLWLFIAAGILGGTLLASLAGVAIAARAMRPISALTATARQIAATGDPSKHMPDPKVTDEVGELARTLEQMLRSLDAARTEREAAMKKQREFVADASHELRTPLTSVLANLELLQASLRSPNQDDDRAMIDSALRSSKRMSRLVGDLLLLARADAGRAGKHGPCDLAEIAGNAAAELAPLMGDRKLEVDNQHALPVTGNPDELHRMVVNLLDNASRHTQPGARIELHVRSIGDEAVIEVADDGPGIPPRLREQIFNRFVRGEGPADTAVGPGSGLGLAIVRAVATSHGGTVEVGESASGGAQFRVRLPLQRSNVVATTF
ncbi:MAG: two-component system, OmpR family, sensor kinase [Solirubrobacterales bacterium]|jgi:signal transduction histidine kinase|nr:two-component system, OmpR family, sensor kinase [Solirubrobacterales bacterium]